MNNRGSKLLSILLSFLVIFSPLAATAKEAGAKEAKQRVVLMPVSGKGVEISALELSIYRSAIAEELSKKYEVYTGTEVDKKILEIFQKESKESLECDAAKCYQDIAIAFQAELIVTAMVLSKMDQYLVRLEINNVFDNKVVHAGSESCEKCSERELIALLKNMAKRAVGEKVEIVAGREKVKKKSKWWLWTLLGIVVVGGGAAYALSSGDGGGGGGGGGGGSTDSTVIITW